MDILLQKPDVFGAIKSMLNWKLTMYRSFSPADTHGMDSISNELYCTIVQSMCFQELQYFHFRKCKKCD